MTERVHPVAFYWAAAMVAIAVAFVAANPPQSTPEGSITLPGVVESVHDGDTATVAVTVRMSVRLLDCWSPELKQVGGPEAKAALISLIDRKRCTVSVPFGKMLGDSFSFGRVLGRISVDGEDASEWMVRKGYATKFKVEE